MPASQDWLDHFHPFSTLHLAAAAVCIAAMAILVATGLRLRTTPAEHRFRRAWGWSILVFQLIAGVWWLLPANFEAQRSIPLNMCRLVAFVAAAAMLAPDAAPWRRWLRATLYFWGLGLCTQALITPVFPEGPRHFLFWVFWIGHTQIVGSALYDLIVLRYRPRAADFVFICVANAAYLAVVIPLNAYYNLNYGGLGPTLFDAPNLARRLGPWPWRPLWIALIAWAWMTLLWRVWVFAGRFAKTREAQPTRTVDESAARDPLMTSDAQRTA